MRPVEAADYLLGLPDADEFKRLTKRAIELKDELDELDTHRKAIRDEISSLNKARWPLLQQLYKIVNKKYDYFDFDELKNILW